MPLHLKNAHSKILHICDCIQRIGWTPKKFLYYFLKNKNIAVATRRGYWGSATELWRKYILKEAQLCVNAELVNRSASTRGSFHSSANINEDFFERAEKETRDKHMITTDMPFLYQLIYNKLQHGQKPQKVSDQNDSDSDCSEDSVHNVDFNLSESATVECDPKVKEHARLEKRIKRSQVFQ
ncbi:hypothetical protein PCASD_02794 [Puccinia coronata f. sp. avenae]|uniref:Uncharacterized protein n=1 Tax=Puccinia coronata f. sp. avenae TaxID=200324 RepID=A0A2N5VFT5_9BASI|nr:hypothetical protein PCASD_02794 [Puccinia coronata f. sp. avenae]